VALMIGQAVISCAGPGTPPNADMPTPLLAVGEAPFLDVLLFELGRHGIRRVVLLAGFAAARIADYAAATPLSATGIGVRAPQRSVDGVYRKSERLGVRPGAVPPIA